MCAVLRWLCEFSTSHATCRAHDATISGVGLSLHEFEEKLYAEPKRENGLAVFQQLEIALRPLVAPTDPV
jgi:hypothetical protein